MAPLWHNPVLMQAPVSAVARRRLLPRRRFHRALVLGVAIVAVVAAALAVRFTARVHALRDRRAWGPAWAFPSRLYSAAVPLAAGAPLPRGLVVRQLEARGYRRTTTPATAPGTFADAPGGLEIALRGFGAEPARRVRIAFAGGAIASVEAAGAALDGAPAPRIEPMLVGLVMDEHRVRRTWVPLARVPRVVSEAIVASEDRRFRSHFGLDLRSNTRALVVNVRAGGLREGGSTITQQLARGLFLGRRRTWVRKFSEMALAVGLEVSLSKDEILEMYLNSVYWGQDGADGIAGIAEAARHYFDLPVDSLGLDEAALLAGLIPAPNLLSPFRRPEAARRERDRVLADMVETGVLDAATAAAASRRPLRTRRGPRPPALFPSFAGAARAELDRRTRPGAAERLGFDVFTTLDPVWQADAESGLREGIAGLESWRGGAGSGLEGAFLAVSVADGAVRCVVGGRSPSAGDFNRALDARRQPGSAIKPVVYAAALDPGRGGRRFTPASTVPDERREFATPEGPWSPRNDEGDYHAEVTLAKALAKSLNVATANLVEAISPATVARYAERFGLGRFRPVASIGLGTHEVTLAALVDAYAVFPNGGLRRPSTFLEAVVDARGDSLVRAPAAAVRVLPAGTAALMTGLLEDVVVFGVSYPLRRTYGFVRPVGGKTGTTNDYLDGWFIGFTPDVVAGVWIGYDRPRNLRAPAAETALPVWARIMNRLLDGVPPRGFDALRELSVAWIDPWTGGLAGPRCPSPMRVSFEPGTAPKTACTRDHTADWEAIAARRLADSLAAAADSSGAAAADSLMPPP
jgi:penicillin-binding protein 1B